MHQPELVDIDAEEWSGRQTAEQSARGSNVGMKRLHGEDKLLPCRSTASTQLPRETASTPNHRNKREEASAP
jgi:hypothetical protein